MQQRYLASQRPSATGEKEFDFRPATLASVRKGLLSIYLSLNTATRPRGHFRQVSAASVSIRQEKIKYRQRIKSMIVKDKNR